MIGVIFQFGNENVEVRIDGFNCLFRTSQTYGGFVPLDSLKLDKKGVMKEHPDLKDNDAWRQEAVQRFKDKLELINSEKGRIEYVIDDLKKYGYKPIYLQRQGSRPVRL